jgi:hypothetical protein
MVGRLVLPLPVDVVPKPVHGHMSGSRVVVKEGMKARYDGLSKTLFIEKGTIRLRAKQQNMFFLEIITAAARQ